MCIAICYPSPTEHERQLVPIIMGEDEPRTPPPSPKKVDTPFWLGGGCWWYICFAHAQQRQQRSPSKSPGKGKTPASEGEDEDEQDSVDEEQEDEEQSDPKPDVKVFCFVLLIPVCFVLVQLLLCSIATLLCSIFFFFFICGQGRGFFSPLAQNESTHGDSTGKVHDVHPIYATPTPHRSHRKSQPSQPPSQPRKRYPPSLLQRHIQHNSSIHPNRCIPPNSSIRCGTRGAIPPGQG